MPTKVAPGPGASRVNLLWPGTATNVVMEVTEERPPDANPLFCCQVSWAESESVLRGWGRQVEKPMYWLAALFGFNWDPPWRHKLIAHGNMFTSNLQVADYFSHVYGFTRESWLEEQRQELKRQAELTRIQMSLPSNHSVRVRTGPLTDREQVELEARAAFRYFCGTFTNVTVGTATAEPGGAANGSQPIGSETNRPSAAAGSGR
jgi:hypothetical protein